MTPKFECELTKDDVVKVKYGEKNGEVYAEVAASRLLWALGFKADTMEPTRVTCHGCPADPFAASSADWQLRQPAGVSTRVYDPAIIEREVPGDQIETPGYEGWAWPELETASEKAGGATRAQIDAFKLLAVFIQHSDTKPDQQEIVCTAGRQKDATGNETCGSPWLVIKDVGGTFGKATLINNSKMKLADWSGETVWKDAKQCIGNLPRSFTGNLDDPKISEAGRAFLAQLLNRLSDRQLRDLFTVSQVVRRGEEMRRWQEAAGDDRRLGARVQEEARRDRFSALSGVAFLTRVPHEGHEGSSRGFLTRSHGGSSRRFLTGVPHGGSPKLQNLPCGDALT